MGDAMPSTPEDRAPAEEGEAEAREGQPEAEELHGKNEEEAQDTTEERQESSGEDIEEQKSGGADEAGEEEEEEPGECGFCLFMKSGPCRDSFINWEQCIEQAEKDKEDMVEKCHKVTFMLKECMEHNSDYYEPVLQAEKAMGEAALEEEAAAAAASHGDANANPPDLQVHSQPENQPSSNASHAQADVPTDVDTEGDHLCTDEHHSHASLEEHHVHTSSDAPAKVSPLPDSGTAAQEQSSA